MLRAPISVHPDPNLVDATGPREPTGSHRSAARKQGKRLRRPELTGGEPSGGATGTNGLLFVARARQARKRAAWIGAIHHGELRRRAAELHGGLTAVRGRGKPRRGARTPCGAKEKPKRLSKRGKEEAERVACGGTSSGELRHGGAEKKISHHSLSPRLQQPHAGANDGA